jgi:hypothetical protein
LSGWGLLIWPGCGARPFLFAWLRCEAQGLDSDLCQSLPHALGHLFIVDTLRERVG